MTYHPTPAANTHFCFTHLYARTQTHTRPPVLTRFNTTMSENYSIIKPVGFTIASCGYCGKENSAHVYGALAFKLTCQVNACLLDSVHLQRRTSYPPPASLHIVLDSAACPPSILPSVPTFMRKARSSRASPFVTFFLHAELRAPPTLASSGCSRSEQEGHQTSKLLQSP